jgi:hypothetical protein
MTALTPSVPIRPGAPSGGCAFFARRANHAAPWWDRRVPPCARAIFQVAASNIQHPRDRRPKRAPYDALKPALKRSWAEVFDCHGANGRTHASATRTKTEDTRRRRPKNAKTADAWNVPPGGNDGRNVAGLAWTGRRLGCFGGGIASTSTIVPEKR